MARGPARAAALGNGLKQDEKTTAAMWAAHYQAGHVPFRRDCEVCLEAAGRDRPRKAIPHPSAFTWSLDLMGPFVESHDQELPYARYGLVTVVTIPTKAELPVVRGLQELGARVPPSRKRPLPQWPEEDVRQEDEVGDWEAQVDPWVEELTEAETTKVEVLAKEWKEFLKDAKDVGPPGEESSCEGHPLWHHSDLCTHSGSSDSSPASTYGPREVVRFQGGDWMDGSKRLVLYVHGRGRAVRKRSG